MSLLSILASPELIQQMGFLLGFSFIMMSCCLFLQQSSSYFGLPLPTLSFSSLSSSVLFAMQPNETSSPPKWITGSGKMSIISEKMPQTSLQVASSVTSRAPMYLPVQATPLFCGARAQDAACPGESISGTTLTPRTMAYLTTSLAWAVVYFSSGLNAAYSASSECLSRESGNESSSVMCQWSTFILLYMRASMVSSIMWNGRQCLAVSIMTPRQVQVGLSLMLMGRQVRLHPFLTPVLLNLQQVNNWENVYMALTIPTYVCASIDVSFSLAFSSYHSSY